MDDQTLSSKEDLISKARKPYTITKQRERWTAEEHNRFLEAIKLYGRAWQRIEEHIGTKTAVQIRSHAQKFFSKLEKEALNKGVPLGQAHDIDIPPPRPKRKPSNPYPRKTSSGIPNSIHMGMKDGNPLKSASSSPSSIQMQDPENNLHLEKPCKKAKGKENVDEDNSSGILSLSRETPCTSFSTSTKAPSISLSLKNKCVFKDYIPSVKERSNAGATDESFLNAGAEGNQKLDRTDANCTYMDDGTSGNPNLNSCCHNLDGQVIKEEELKQPENLCLLPKEDIQSNQNYPRHIPVHVLESSSETCSQSLSHYMTHQTSFIHQVEGTFRNVNNFTNPAASENYSNISIQQSVQNFPSPLNPGSSNHDSYNMFVNPTFHNLILSTLLQNPAAHAAASFVASLWPFTNVETSVDSPPCTIEGFQLRHGGPSPSASAIATATVMAASAWWAANGLLPLCPPVHAGYTCIPAPTNSSPTDSTLVLVEKDKKNQRLEASTWEGQQLNPGLSKPAEPKLSNCKSLLLSPADFNENESVMSKSDAVGHEQKPVSITGFHESEKGKAKEQVDRSSCGSNTPSGSEVEMDMLEKHANGKDESKEHNVNQRTSEPNNNRNRSMAILAESWREVSEEGKIAFKALFSREVLPQSFSPPKCLGNNGQLMKSNEEGLHKSYEEKDDDKLQLDLNSKTPLTCPDCGENEKGELPPSGGQIEEGLLLMGCGHGKLKARRTGFKPYKRCSVEAGKASRVMSENNQGEERDAKRVCLEGEASI